MKPARILTFDWFPDGPNLDKQCALIFLLVGLSGKLVQSHEILHLGIDFVFPWVVVGFDAQPTAAISFGEHMRRVWSGGNALPTAGCPYGGGRADVCGPDCDFVVEQELVVRVGEPKMDLAVDECVLFLLEAIGPLTMISPVSSFSTRV